MPRAVWWLPERPTTLRQNEARPALPIPKVIPNGDDQVKLFYLAGEDRVWHPASMKIDGDKVVVTSPGVKKPRGVSYGTGEIGLAAEPLQQGAAADDPVHLLRQRRWSPARPGRTRS
jgi:hypothetical protein